MRVVVASLRHSSSSRRRRHRRRLHHHCHQEVVDPVVIVVVVVDDLLFRHDQMTTLVDSEHCVESMETKWVVVSLLLSLLFHAHEDWHRRWCKSRRQSTNNKATILASWCWCWFGEARLSQ